MAKDERPVCVVFGVGPGNGAALARRFASEGYRVALLARSADTTAALARELKGRAFACDAGNPANVTSTFEEIRAEMGEIEVLVWNAGSGKFGSAEEVSPQDLADAVNVNAVGALAAAQQVIPAMKVAKSGAIVFIGATASRRGGARFAAFAPGKAAQRSLAESLARLLWPSGVHVSLIVVDGVVDLPRTRKMMSGKPDDYFIRPDDVAAAALALVKQPRSTWTFELEVRPYGEAW